MSLVREVASDLWHFAKSELAGNTNVHQESELDDSIVTAYQGAVAVEREAELYQTDTSSSHDIAEYYDDSAIVDTGNKIAYIKYPDTYLYQRPAYAFDVKLSTVPYGHKVSLQQVKGDWVRVSSSEKEGWVEIENISLQPNAVFPNFIPRKQYSYTDIETQKLRLYIEDEFSGQLAKLPALNTEYVWYRIVRAGKTFTWPPISPRTPGRWASILAGEPTVLISSVPLTGAIMEYRENTVAELMYVESVDFDESIRLRGFAGNESGVFVHTHMSIEEWKNKDAKFICTI